jgi:hypothetical protein
MIAFILTMPNRGSWNGRWSGENDLHAIVKTERSVPKDIIGKSFWYNWDDGWSACVSVEKVDCREGNKLRQKSRGFCGYNWMVDSLIKKGRIE